MNAGLAGLLCLQERDVNRSTNLVRTFATLLPWNESHWVLLIVTISSGEGSQSAILPSICSTAILVRKVVKSLQQSTACSGTQSHVHPSGNIVRCPLSGATSCIWYINVLAALLSNLLLPTSRV